MYADCVCGMGVCCAWRGGGGGAGCLYCTRIITRWYACLGTALRRINTFRVSLRARTSSDRVGRPAHPCGVLRREECVCMSQELCDAVSRQRAWAGVPRWSMLSRPRVYIYRRNGATSPLWARGWTHILSRMWTGSNRNMVGGLKLPCSSAVLSVCPVLCRLLACIAW